MAKVRSRSFSPSRPRWQYYYTNIRPINPARPPNFVSFSCWRKFAVSFSLFLRPSISSSSSFYSFLYLSLSVVRRSFYLSFTSAVFWALETSTWIASNLPYVLFDYSTIFAVPPIYFRIQKRSRASGPARPETIDDILLTNSSSCCSLYRVRYRRKFCFSR